jgi:hypothetical protein
MTDRLDERKENEELMEHDPGREGASRHEGTERDPLTPSTAPDDVGQQRAGSWHGGGWRPYGEEGDSDGHDHDAAGPAAEDSDNQSSGSTQDAVRGTRSSTGTGGAGGGLNSGPGGAAGR